MKRATPVILEAKSTAVIQIARVGAPKALAPVNHFTSVRQNLSKRSSPFSMFAMLVA